MCSRYLTQTSHNPVKTLKNMCIDHLIYNIETHAEVLSFLPENIKNRILKRLINLPLKYSDLKCLYANLVHSQVKQIDFSTTYVDDELLNIISKCKNLTDLTLTGKNEQNLTSTGIIEAIENFEKLLILKAPNCFAINDAVTTIAVKSCPNLAGIDFSGCENITDKSLEEIAKLSNLTALKLSKTKVSTLGIITISAGMSNLILKELHMDLCDNITHEAIHEVCKYCSSLEVLVFNNCSKINDQSCINIENNICKKLKQLTWTVYW